MQTLVAVSLELKQDGDSTCGKSPCRSQMCRQDQQLLFIATRSRPQLQGVLVAAHDWYADWPCSRCRRTSAKPTATHYSFRRLVGRRI